MLTCVVVVVREVSELPLMYSRCLCILHFSYNYTAPSYTVQLCGRLEKYCLKYI